MRVNLTPHVLVLVFGAAVFEATIGGAQSPPVAPRMARLQETTCTARQECERIALQLGLDPQYALMPDDALLASCKAGDETACAYLMPCDWPPVTLASR